MRFFLFVFFSISISNHSLSQFFEPINYPKGYFRNPLNIPISLSGNFGELRPNHFHMGLDLRTEAKQNLPVYASADGYISRIKIEPGGFGRAIYINHPNGYTTLYAHLNDFDPMVERWVKEQQYQQQSWRVFLELNPGQFPIKKGAFIGYSGNTGGSQAPHLHFEIRRTADDVNLNPLLFGLPLEDNTQPRILRLAIYDRSRSVYEQSPRLIPVKQIAAGNFVSVPPVISILHPKASFAISAFDTHSGSSNLNGIYEAVLYIDGVAVTGFRLDAISYNSTRYLNAHVDFKTKATGGSYLQNLSELPGYINSIYKNRTDNNVITFADTAIHLLQIVVKDAYQNTSTFECKIKYVGFNSQSSTHDSRLSTSASRIFYPLMLDGLENEECEFYIGERCLYDSVSIRYNKIDATAAGVVSSTHAIGAPYIPLQEAFLIRIKPTRSLTMTEKSKTVMQWYAGKKTDIQKVDWQQQWAGASFREFGFYQLLVDMEPPQIVPINFAEGVNLSKATRMIFTVKDNLDKFKNVKAELDGKWLRFTNDKGRTFIYTFDENCLSGSHSLKIHAEDEAGNISEKIFVFTR